MQYLSLTFVAFVAAAFLLFYTIPKQWRWGVLLVASVIFYGLFDLKYLAFLLFTALSTWLTALILGKVKIKKLLIALCILANAAVWFCIKELPWVLTKLGVDVSALSVIVPVGISYFTLQAIAYLADVAKGKVQAERNPLKYLLFLSWFPAIVQGPISRYNQLAPQLTSPQPFSFDRTRDSLVLILFGLVKKLVIADRLGIFVNAVFSQYAQLQGVILYLGAIAYSIQLYADFSGCVDICRGVSGLFGVELIHNFKRPYLSRSTREFWDRWHISLSSWLKDYIYIPLGGNRKGTAVKYLNILIVFLVSGLWHGAGFQFLLWGVMHAVYQIVGQCTEGLRARVRGLLGIEACPLSKRIYQTVITFHLVMLAWVPFRAGDLMTGMHYIRNMFSGSAIWMLFDGSIYNFGLNQNYMVFLLVHICILFAAEARTKKQEDVVKGITAQHLFIRWATYLVLIFDVLLFGVYGSGYDMASFMYGGF